MAKISVIGPRPTLCSEGICAVLQHHGHEVAFFAPKFDTSFSGLNGHIPDIVLFDFDSSTEIRHVIAHWLRSIEPSPRVIGFVQPIPLVSLRPWPVLHIDGLLSAGSIDSLLECVSAVASGERWLDPDLLDTFSRNDDLFSLLSPREQEVVNWLEHGLRNKEIARKLNVCEGTVKMHLHHIFSKLRIQRRAQISVLAAAHQKQSPSPNGRNDKDGTAWSMSYFSRHARVI